MPLSWKERASKHSYANRLVELGTKAGTMAHDFANLLTPIQAGLRRVEREGTDQLKQRIGMAVAATDRAIALVHALRGLASDQPLKLEDVDVKNAMTDIAPILQSSLGSAIDLIVDVNAGVSFVRANRTELERAILNLVVNARDAIASSGVVRLSAAKIRLSGEPEGLKGEYVAISVRDTGSGMSPEVLAHAFEPLFTTKGPNGGTGLGLASVYGFAKRSGGTAVVESEIGKGTTVTIFLEASDQTTSP
jgi:signal transduction histidine kinase